MTLYRGLTQTDRRLLADERRALVDRLARVSTDSTLDVLTKSAERRALRERIAEIDEETR